MSEYIKIPFSGRLRGVTYEDGKVTDVHIMDTDGVVKVFEPVRHAKWVDNHCTACGMMPMGDEMWKLCDFEPPRFEKFMDYCPSCGAKMDRGNCRSYNKPKTGWCEVHLDCEHPNGFCSYGERKDDADG